MGVNWGQLRFAVVIVFLFVSVKVVLYQSAAYDATAATTPSGTSQGLLMVARQQRGGGGANKLSHSHSGGGGGGGGGGGDNVDRIVLKSRWRNAKGASAAEWVSGTAAEGSGRKTAGKHPTARRERFAERRAEEGTARGLTAGGKRTRGGSSSSPTLSRRNSNNRSLQAMPETSNMAAAGKSDQEFDIDTVLKLFSGCKADTGELSLDCYNDAFEELCKLFKPLGTVFNFVTSDIVEKIGILRDYRASELGEHFRTIQGMVKYEVDNNLTNQKKKASGCRTLLRLHRALEFISALLKKLLEMDNGGKFSTEASASYDVTLAKYHPWLIKKAVHLAMYTLPTRGDMLVKMKVTDTPEDMAKMRSLIEELTVVYDITQDLYTDNKLHELP